MKYSTIILYPGIENYKLLQRMIAPISTSELIINN